MVVKIEIPNVCYPAPGLCTGGQPPAEQLRSAQAQGVRTVINLRPASEAVDFDEPALAAELGLRYIHLPISGAPDITVDNAKKLAAALQQAGDAPVLVHCASGNRVGALFALKARAVDGLAPEAALAFGKTAGLTGLEPVVRAQLGI